MTYPRPAAVSPSALRAHRFLMRFALGGATVFAWIFVFQYFYVTSSDPARAFAHAALLYALAQALAALVTPFAARLLRNGARRSMVFAVLFAAAGFVALGATFAGMLPWQSAIFGILGFATMLALYRAIYWIPYAVETHGVPGKSALGLDALAALAPIAAGLLLVSTQAPAWLLFGASGLILASIVPLFNVTETHERFSWRYRETFAHLIAKEHRSIVIPALLDGAVAAALLFVWPIAVFLIIGWSYSVLGIILSLTLLVGLLVRGSVRHTVRKISNDSALLNAVFAATPWLLRLVVATPLGVVLVDSYFYTTSSRRFGMDPLVLEQASDGGSYVDEYTALKEIGLSIGRIAMCSLGAIIALFASLPVAFIGVFLAAAIVSMLAVRDFS